MLLPERVCVKFLNACFSVGFFVLDLPTFDLVSSLVGFSEDG